MSDDSPQVWWHQDDEDSGYMLCLGATNEHLSLSWAQALVLQKRLAERLRKIPARCLECGRPFLAESPSTHYCSVACHAKSHTPDPDSSDE